jgi:hypothetical protein
MRIIVLFPMTVLVAVAAGCGSLGREQATRSVPQRNLTLVPQTPAVEIASPVETRQLRIQHRTVRHSQLAVRLAAVAVPTPVLAIAQPVAQPTTTAAPANDRELLPGKTVTVIPAGSTPSTGSDVTDEIPAARGRTMAARGKGGCRGRGRGPGIGMGPAPRPDFR